MTTLAGTAYRRTVGVAGEPTVGRATALVAVVMCLAAVSETSYGASNGGLGEPDRKSLCHADRRSQSGSSAFANRRSAGLTLQSVVANK